MKINQYKALYLIMFIMIESLLSNAQKKENEGYLLRCFASTKISIEKLRDNFMFATYLSENDLFDYRLIDSVHFSKYKEGRFFEIWFSSIFSNDIKLIDNVWDKREDFDTTCKPNEKIYLDDLSLYDLVYVYKTRFSEFYYIIMINKVLIEYCHLDKHSIFLEMYKGRIGLKKKPTFLPLTQIESDLFIKKLKNTTGIDGEVLMR